MLGYPTAFMAYMCFVNCNSRRGVALTVRCYSILATSFFILLFAGPASAEAVPQQARLPFKSGGVAELSSSGPQSRRGDLYIADGDVDIHYGDSRPACRSRRIQQ